MNRPSFLTTLPSVCDDCQALRYQTQDLLRQKVSSHYQMFMRGTEDIQHVEQVRPVVIPTGLYAAPSHLV
jgi:hypothetical protein